MVTRFGKEKSCGSPKKDKAQATPCFLIAVKVKRRKKGLETYETSKFRQGVLKSEKVKPVLKSTLCF